MQVHNYDHGGFYTGASEADPSPLEPGKFLFPARSTEIAPPTGLPDDKVARWNGAEWEAVNRPTRLQDVAKSPVDKLAEFLRANPDVAAMLDTSNPEDTQE